MIAKIFGIVFVELAVYVLLKQYKPEFAVLSELAAAALVILMTAGELADVRSFFSGAMEASGLGTEYGAILLKSLGTALIAQLAANAARDSGQSALAEKIEFAGKILVLTFTLPVLKGILQMIASFSENLK